MILTIRTVKKAVRFTKSIARVICATVIVTKMI